jgi:hypothetical protein
MHPIRRSVLLAAFCYGVQLNPSAQAQKVETPELSAEVAIHAHANGKQTDMVISLASKRGASVSMTDTELPWGNWTSIALALVEARSNEALHIPVWPLEGLGTSTETLRPREELKGSFSLSERFPKLEEVLRKSDVIVFWSFQLKPRFDFETGVRPPAFERIGGWTLIPQRTPPK